MLQSNPDSTDLLKNDLRADSETLLVFVFEEVLEFGSLFHLSMYVLVCIGRLEKVPSSFASGPEPHGPILEGFIGIKGDII